MFAMFCTLSIRSNLGVTIVCMVNSTAYSNPKSTADSNLSISDACPEMSAHFQEFGYDGHLLWDSNLQGLMFSAVSMGAVVVTLPSGFMADRYSPKLISFWGLMASAVITYFSPMLTEFHEFGFVASRFLLGCLNGFITPSFQAIASRWFVPDERSTLNAVYTSGAQISGVFLGLVTPPLCESKDLGGWEAVYHLCAILTIVWGVTWMIFSSSYAEKNRFITVEERDYVETHIMAKKDKTKAMFPWLKAFTNLPFLAVLITRASLIIQQQVLTFYTASYIRDVLKADLKSFVSNIGVALCFSGLAIFADCNHVFLAVSLLTLQGVFTSLVSPGMQTSAMSIAPYYAGTLYSVTMFISYIVASGAPTLVSYILVHNSPEEWSIVFHLLAATNVIPGIFFAIFGSAKIQEWAKPAQMKLSELGRSVSTVSSTVSV
ncbi:hypothetical protein L596_020696 [Steinernema carpocapsae]|uniref:Major facilitator superfamily (MFS) profile domain-containing protein n=1 Tax=Steinernema carpocapsae TaxID=34508 RepID=A0A4U5MUZ2_STECR|nr:hypothetical protein L596_020696 [Steinernema carpocapsae]